MFIERSTAKIRGVRALFLCAGLLPCAALVGWAAMRHSSAHRDAIRREAEVVLGMPVTIGSVEHVRPGAMRLRDCAVVAPGAGVVFAVPEAEVETSSGEVRLRLPEAACGPAAVTALMRVAEAWLDEPVRFPRAWVVEVGAFAWDTAMEQGVAAGSAVAEGGGRGRPLRIECVAAGESRAIRIRRPAGPDEEDGDELRVIATAGAPRRYEVIATVRQPLPWGVIRPALPPAVVGGLPLGPAAFVTGSLEAVSEADGWAGSARGLVEGLDLADLSPAGRHRLEGALAVAVERLDWHAGRIVGLEASGSAMRGRIAQSLLGALVSTCGCRPGPAFRSLADETMRPFDDLLVAAVIDGHGLRIAAGPERTGSLVRRQGLSLIDEPVGPIPLDRLAWLLGPADAPAVPVSASSSWLMRILPSPAGRREESTAVRPSAHPRQKSEF